VLHYQRDEFLLGSTRCFKENENHPVKKAVNNMFSQGPSLFHTPADGAPTAEEINIASL